MIGYKWLLAAAGHRTGLLGCLLFGRRFFGYLFSSRLYGYFLSGSFLGNFFCYLFGHCCSSFKGSRLGRVWEFYNIEVPMTRPMKIIYWFTAPSPTSNGLLLF